MTCYTRPNEGRSDLLYSNYYEGRGGRGDRGVIGLQCPEKESISPRYVKNRLAKFPPMHPRTRSCLRPQEHLVRPRATVAFPSNNNNNDRWTKPMCHDYPAWPCVTQLLTQHPRHHIQLW